MNIHLSARDGATILTASGPVDRHNFDVLKSGISKLMRDGKNRLILNLEDASELETTTLRELAILDVLARELSGKIVLVSSNEELKECVRAFARPPVVPIFSTVDQALEYFRLAAKEESEHEGAAALRLKLAAAERKSADLEARLGELSTDAVRAVRDENATLKAKLSILEEQVESLVKENRAPADPEGYLEKIAALEASVKRLAGEGPRA